MSSNLLQNGSILGVNSHQWWSPEKSRDSSRDTFLRVSVSVSKVLGLEILNATKKWFIKICIIQWLFVCCVCRQETTKTRRKKPEIWKKMQVRSYDNIFEKNVGRMHKFWNLESRPRTSSLESRPGRGDIDEVSVSSRNFNQVSVSKVTVSTTSLVPTLFLLALHPWVKGIENSRSRPKLPLRVAK